jgi:hypothetical protein
MQALRNLLDRIGKPFHPGGKLERWFPLYEAADTFFYSPGSVTRTGAHVRDAMDLKRMMILVVIACLPCVFMAMYNTGLQANLALDPAKVAQLDGWRHAVIALLGVGYSPHSLVANVIHGSLYFLPLYIRDHGRGPGLGGAVRGGAQDGGQRRLLRHRPAVPADLPARPRRCGRPHWRSALPSCWARKCSAARA